MDGIMRKEDTVCRKKCDVIYILAVGSPLGVSALSGKQLAGHYEVVCKWSPGGAQLHVALR